MVEEHWGPNLLFPIPPGRLPLMEFHLHGLMWTCGGLHQWPNQIQILSSCTCICFSVLLASDFWRPQTPFIEKSVFDSAGLKGPSQVGRLGQKVPKQTTDIAFSKSNPLCGPWPSSFESMLLSWHIIADFQYTPNSGCILTQRGKVDRIDVTFSSSWWITWETFLNNYWN